MKILCKQLRLNIFKKLLFRVLISKWTKILRHIPSYHAAPWGVCMQLIIFKQRLAFIFDKCQPMTEMLHAYNYIFT